MSDNMDIRSYFAPGSPMSPSPTSNNPLHGPWYPDPKVEMVAKIFVAGHWRALPAGSAAGKALIEKHKFEVLDQLDQAEAASYDFGYKKARQDLEEQIQFTYDQGYFQGVHEEQTRIKLSQQHTHLPGWCSGWPIELEPLVTEI